MPTPAHLTVRHARTDDCQLISDLIYELAVYERLADQARATPELLEKSLFGDRRCAEALIGEVNGEAAGYAIFFTSFSTFTGKPGIYLEDIYVRSHWRKHGLGKAMLQKVAAIAVERDCPRLEWSVLDWNEPAVAFYERIGAEQMPQWLLMRVGGQALEDLAAR